MKCTVCGSELQSETQKCPTCIDTEHKVQVLTPEAKQDFGGITIEQEDGKTAEEYSDPYSGYNEKQRIYIKHVNFGTGQTGLFTKIILGIIFLGLLIVALPIALFCITLVGFFLYFVRK
ncbi:hypothetical protein [Pelosinus sp. UFO1]|jgi:hypothetical protein|uniref:hypothetical protein n=1 Tax=Pelosinus sp. UFO1 TaxID=484770 RepID=UPI0004D1EF22|nr:hypothetical protein [Pelosinus sp. UFO1]AIF52170.1 hypothetical protein UFO1_2627 [Pelosinus sp. UFO1]